MRQPKWYPSAHQIHMHVSFRFRVQGVAYKEAEVRLLSSRSISSVGGGRTRVLESPSHRPVKYVVTFLPRR